MNKIFFQDKRGDIPIMVLVIGIVSICLLAIISFVSVIFMTNNSFYGINTMEKMNIMIEEYNFYKNIGIDKENIIFEPDFDIRSWSNYGLKDNYLFAERTDFNRVVFSVKYYLP